MTVNILLNTSRTFDSVSDIGYRSNDKVIVFKKIIMVINIVNSLCFFINIIYTFFLLSLRISIKLISFYLEFPNRSSPFKFMVGFDYFFDEITNANFNE